MRHSELLGMITNGVAGSVEILRRMCIVEEITHCCHQGCKEDTTWYRKWSCDLCWRAILDNMLSKKL